MNSWKAFLHPAGCGSIFPAKSCLDGWRSGSWLARVRWISQMRQNFAAQFVQLLKHWLYDVWWGGGVGRIGPFLLTKAGCRHCSFWCISSICWALFMYVMVSAGLRKLQWIRWAADHQTMAMTISWCTFDFDFDMKCFGASSLSSHRAGHYQLSYTIRFSSHVMIRLKNGSLLHRIREDDTSEWQFVWFLSALEAPSYQAPFTFPVYFKCWATLR